MVLTYLPTFTSLILFLLSFQSILSQNKKELLRAKIKGLHEETRLTESIPYLEKYLELEKNDLHYRLIYAKSLLFRNDLEPVKSGDTVFIREQKIHSIRENYLQAAKIFNDNLPFFTKADPLNPSIGKWYFLWALSEYYAGNPEKSLRIFKHAVRLDFTLVDSWYNIASLYDFMGKRTDAKRYFRIFFEKEKEKETASWPK